MVEDTVKTKVKEDSCSLEVSEEGHLYVQALVKNRD